MTRLQISRYAILTAISANARGLMSDDHVDLGRIPGGVVDQVQDMTLLQPTDYPLYMTDDQGYGWNLIDNLYDDSEELKLNIQLKQVQRLPLKQKNFGQAQSPDSPYWLKAEDLPIQYDEEQVRLRPASLRGNDNAPTWNVVKNWSGGEGPLAAAIQRSGLGNPQYEMSVGDPWRGWNVGEDIDPAVEDAWRASILVNVDDSLSVFENLNGEGLNE